MAESAITVTENDFSVAEEYGELRNKARFAGAIVTFVGLVRDLTEAHAVDRLTLQHYPGMTENLLGEIIDEASSRWNLEAARVVHRVGELAPADQIVFVGVAAAHRGEAFQACEYIMDYLKVRATIWKKEHRPDGEIWLDDRAADHDSLSKWCS